MDKFYSRSNNKISIISILIILSVTVVGVSSSTSYTHEKSFSLMVFAQEFPNLFTNSSNISSSTSDDSSNNTSEEQNESKTVMASGHFANNQMEDGTVTWIQGGLWNLEIDNSSNKNIENPNMSATFDANFTMIRPDGSLNHNHIISNLTSDNVIFAGNDIVVTGGTDIYTDNGTEYEQVPITIHLMGKQVLGLMIDVNKTRGHFSSSNEMYGTLISGIGLDNSSNNNNTTSNGRTPEESNNSSITNSMAQMMH
ncbi:MAG: hypothetical protein P0116_02370 [Candidatus Nitrosocosmicus sp.]|nr:hypothetical protein [Candidatus Nitrosocosmicus sp.]